MAASASLTFSLGNGTIGLGEPMLIGNASICWANWRRVDSPALREVTAWSGSIRAWEDLRLVGAWSPAHGCFDAQIGWTADESVSTRPAIADGLSSPTQCVNASSMAVETCEMHGMIASAIDDQLRQPLRDALGAPPAVTSALASVHAGVMEAVTSVARQLELCDQLLPSQGQPLEDSSLLRARHAAWSLSLEAASDTLNSTADVLRHHASQQAHSVLERMPRLESLLNDAFEPAWLDRHAVVADITSRVEAMAAQLAGNRSQTLADTNSSSAAIFTDLSMAMDHGRTILQQLNLVHDASDPLLTDQLHLAQLQLEMSGQLIIIGLIECAVGMAASLISTMTGVGCTSLEGVLATGLVAVSGDWWLTAEQIVRTWQAVLNEVPVLSAADTESVVPALACLSTKAGEARQLTAVFLSTTELEEESGWTAEGSIGFDGCRTLHSAMPRVELNMNDVEAVSDVADAAHGLVAVAASTEDGMRQLRYLPFAATATVGAEARVELGFGPNDRALHLHMADSFEGWSPVSGRLLRRLELSASTPMEEPEPTRLPRRVGQSCNAGAASCHVDMWCDPATWTIESVGPGQYSASGECERHNCTSIDNEIFPATYGMPVDDPAYTSSGGGSDACTWACGAGYYAQPIGVSTVGTQYQCWPVYEGEWSRAGENTINQCEPGRWAVARGDAVWTSGQGWATPYCPFMCTKVDMYQHNRSDCLPVPNGYYSPPDDNAAYVCTNQLELPAELQIFTSSGNGTDSCTSSPRLSSYVRPRGSDGFTGELRAPFTAETWLMLNEMEATSPVAVIGAFPHWHFTIQITPASDGIGSIVAADMVLVSAALHAPLEARSVPWLSGEHWNHFAAVGQDRQDGDEGAACCYYVNSMRLGCAPFTNRSAATAHLVSYHGSSVSAVDITAPLYTHVPAFFVGGTRGLDAAGFPSGFLLGTVDEVRLHRRALSPPHLGYHQTAQRLAHYCTGGDVICGGRCVARCLGTAWMNSNTCECSCETGQAYSAAEGRCLPPCGDGMTRTADDECGCAADSYKVWRGRYLGISSPSLLPDYTRHTWHHTTATIGLAEIWLHDAMIRPVAVQSCYEYDLASGADSSPVAEESLCTALYDAPLAGSADSSSTVGGEVQVGEQFRSAGEARMRIVLDLGRVVNLSRLAVANYGPPPHTSVGARQLMFYLADEQGDVPTEQQIFHPSRLIVDGEVLRTDEGTAPASVFDDRARSPKGSTAMSCAQCVPDSAGSVLPRSSAHDCLCPDTHYKEWRHELGQCLPRLPALPPPLSSLAAGVVAPGSVVELSPGVAVAGLDGSSPEVCVTVVSSPGAAPDGHAPKEAHWSSASAQLILPPPQPAPARCGSTVQLTLSRPARFYVIRAVTAHRMHMPSEETLVIFHTEVPLPRPSLSPLAGAARAYPLAVRLHANATAEEPSDSDGVVVRYTIDGSNVSADSPILPPVPIGATLRGNTTVRARAYHDLYYASEESIAFYHVLLPSRSYPQLPLALQHTTQGAREVPEGTQLQIGRVGTGHLWYALFPAASPTNTRDMAVAQCEELQLTEWQLYTRTLTLTTASGALGVSSSLVLCACLREWGYVDSPIMSAALILRPWARTVSILHDAQQPVAGNEAATVESALTVTMRADDGAVVWYILEPHNGSSPLCDARAVAFHAAPNLTLAADDAWLGVLTTQV